MWRRNGLATYLLCMLIKQYIGAGDTMDDSVLCLQANPEERSIVSYYQHLGFITVIAIGGEITNLLGSQLGWQDHPSWLYYPACIRKGHHP